MNQQILDRYRSFWKTYSMVDDGPDFVSMAKCIKGMLCFDLHKGILEEVERMCAELERYQPLMDLDEFTTCTKVIIYARRRIELTRGARYASRLSATLTDSELAELRSASAISPGGVCGQSRGPEDDGDPGDDDDLRAQPNDGAEPG